MSRHNAVGQAQAGLGSADKRIIEEAAEWLVKLENGILEDTEQQQLLAWREQSPKHTRAWQAALELKGLLGSVPSALGTRILDRPRSNRRTVLKSLTGLIVAVPTGWLVYRQLPWDDWSADYRTATGEQQQLMLPDGSRLQLNTATAVDVIFDENLRRLVLHKGEILVETVPDPASTQRDFVVQTNQGHIRALGTRFIVRETKNEWGARTWVTVLDHAVAINPALLDTETRLAAGQQASFTRTEQSLLTIAAEGEPAWTRGQIIADEQRLGNFLDELARYRPGILRYDPAVADLRISGVFQINDTDRVLNIIAETLPVRISRLTDYWVSVLPSR